MEAKTKTEKTEMVCTIFNDLRERLDAVTPAMVEATERRIGEREKTEEHVGYLTEHVTRCLFTLMRSLKAERDLEAALARQALEAEVETDHQQRAHIADALADVVEQLFWAQAKADLGLWGNESIGVRKNWELVRTQPPKDNFLNIMRGVVQPPD